MYIFVCIYVYAYKYKDLFFINIKTLQKYKQINLI